MSDPSEQPTRNDSDLDEKKINNILPTDPESELNIISSCLHEMLQIHFEDNLPSSISSASNKEKLHLISTQLTSQSNSISELESMLQRAQADHQNYKKRKQTQYEAEKLRSIESILLRLFDLRDGLVLLSEQYHNADAVSSMGAILANLDSTFASSNVIPIVPSPGDQIDPYVHEVFSTIEGSQPPGTIEVIHRIGYSSGSKVLRPAQVSISSGPLETQ
tara:strand:- start:28419 stop:29075 length:657 start_codon:yes stop_codon:yes gene_type:complete